MKKNLDYIVFESFEVSLEETKKEITSKPLFFIKSTWIKKSGGQGLVDYYENIFFDSNLKRFEDNKIKLNGFSFMLEEKEIWRTIKGNTRSNSLKAEITDKIGELEEILFDMRKNPQIRFNEIFYYLKLIDTYGTHTAARKILSLENELIVLKDKIRARKF